MPENKCIGKNCNREQKILDDIKVAMSDLPEFAKVFRLIMCPDKCTCDLCGKQWYFDYTVDRTKSFPGHTEYIGCEYKKIEGFTINCCEECYKKYQNN